MKSDESIFVCLPPTAHAVHHHRYGVSSYPILSRGGKMSTKAVREREEDGAMYAAG